MMQLILKTLPFKKKHFIFIFLIWSGIIVAQEYIDLAKFDYAITPVNNFDGTNTSTTLQEINGNLTIPIVINDQFSFLTGITYENISASFAPGRIEESLTGLTLKLGVNMKYSSKWSGTYMLLPKISSDFKEISNRDFQLGAAVLMKYIKSDRLSYNFGAYANSDLFGPFIVPLFGFYYLSPSKKLEVKVLLPLSLDFNYSMTKKMKFGLNFLGQVRSYNLNTPIGTESNRYLVKSSKDLYTYFQYDIKNGFNFQLGLGRSIGRSYRIYNEKISLGLPLISFGDNRTQLNSDFSDSWLFKAAVFYRFKIKKTTVSKTL